MKRVVFACLGMLGLAATANAADLPRRYDPVPQRAFVPVYNWTGFYIGINGGGAWGDSKWDSVGTFDVSGGMIGGTVGYNWQIRAVGVRPRGRRRLDQHQRQLDRGLRAGLQDQQQLAGHGARPRRLFASTASCPTSPAVLRSATSRPASRASPAATTPMPAGPPAAASNSSSPATGPRKPSISMSISASSTAASAAATASIRTTCRSARTWCAAA